MEYEVVSSREFRSNMKKYLDLADEGKTIFIKRIGGRIYRLGVPSKLPEGFMAKVEKPTVCEHGKEAGDCLVVWCKFNSNNLPH